MIKQRERKVVKRSDNCWIVNVPVSFNVKDPYQERLLAAAERFPNFSGAMKRLLDEWVRGGEVTPQAFTAHPAYIAPIDEDEATFDPVEAFLGV